MDILLQVPYRNLSGLRARLEEVNKRARRLGLPGITLEPEGEPETRSVWVSVVRDGVERGRNRLVMFHPLRMRGEAVHLDGWAFVATLYHEGDGATLVATVPGEEIPAAWQWATNRCDHCGHSRRRNATYLLRHALCENRNPCNLSKGHSGPCDSSSDPELKQVGRSCLKDFFPQSRRNPETLARWAEVLTIFYTAVRDCEDMDWGSGMKGEAVEDLEWFLTVVALVMRQEGWVSKGRARDDDSLVPTVSHVQTYLYPPPKGAAEEWLEKMGKPTGKDRELALNTLDWAEKNFIGEDLKLSDYEHNLGVVTSLGYVRSRHWGLAASMVSGYERAVGRARGGTEALLPSLHLGTDGGRVRLHDVEVLFTKVMPDRGWGSSLMVKMRHRGVKGEENDLVWFSSSGAPLVPGDIICHKATVSGHDAWQGRSSTKLNRVVWALMDGDTGKVDAGKVNYDDYDPGEG